MKQKAAIDSDSTKAQKQPLVHKTEWNQRSLKGFINNPILHKSMDQDRHI